jgi:uncharacterized protein (TIGR00255 family)
MIKSMTGFGQVTINTGDLNITVEVKSLNSKFLDLNLRLSKQFSEKELELRNIIAEKLERGKVSLSIDYQRTGRQEIRQTYNEALFVAYYKELQKLADSVHAPALAPIFEIALNSPEVIQGNGKEELDPAEWERVLRLVNESIEKCEQFRVQEGKVLQEKLVGYIHAIESGLKSVEEIDPKRIEKVRNKIKGSITEFFGSEGFDPIDLSKKLYFILKNWIYTKSGCA